VLYYNIQHTLNKMVKNSNGGGNAKKQARKYQQSNSSEKKEVRQILDPMERNAEVIEMMGGRICKVKFEGEERNCHIGGKFRGRNKRSNYIEKGGMAIVGIREWSSGGDVDLVYVYEREDSNKLKREMGIRNTEEEDEEDEEEDKGYEFVEEKMTEKEKKEMISGTIKKVEEESTIINIEDL
jgi:hypothetical protein